MNIRFKLALVFFTFLFFCISARLFYWQFVRAEELSSMGQAQYGTNITVPPTRGDIRTSDGYSIAANKISYLPWDKQIQVESITSLYIGTLNEYARILKQNAQLCLMVSKPELLIKHAKNIFPKATITYRTIGLLGQNPSIVLIQ